MLNFEPVTEHISRLELAWRPLPGVRIPVAVWLVRGPEGFTLVDAGLPGSADALLSAVARATEGRGPRRVLLTHGHYDHAGGLEALRQSWNPPVLCHREEVPFVTGERAYRDQPSRSLAFRLGRWMTGTAGRGVPVARELEGGEAAGGMVVIHLPGHTPGQVGFLHAADRAMICGDAVVNFRARLGPPLAIATPDPETAWASIRRLADLDFDHLLPSHGPPVLARGQEAVRALLARRRGG